MIELLAFAMIVGQREIAPNLIQTEYLQNSTEIITVIEEKKWHLTLWTLMVILQQFWDLLE